MVDRVILDVRADAEEQVPRKLVGDGIVASHRRCEACIYAWAIPAQSVGRLFESFGARDTLGPEAERAVGPDVDFADVADGTGLDVFDGSPRVVQRMPLITHLG